MAHSLTNAKSNRAALMLIFFLFILVPLTTQAQPQTNALAFEGEWFDLETGTIIPDPNPLSLPSQADFNFSYNDGFTPHSVIRQNSSSDVQIAYSTESYSNVLFDDITLLAFSTSFFDVPFNQVAVIYTPEGNYYKLGFVSENLGTFQVTFQWEQLLPTPEDFINDLLSFVDGLGLPEGLENSLNSSLNNAKNSLQNGNNGAAINKLEAFINKVEAQSGKEIDAADADDLIADAQAIIDAIQSSLSKSSNEKTINSVDYVPQSYNLRQNYPNPFNPTTQIEFSIPEAGNVTLKIYNSVGQLVKTLVNGNISEGYHQVTWDATDNSGNKLSSGVYFYRITARTFTQINKMMLLK